MILRNRFPRDLAAGRELVEPGLIVPIPGMGGTTTIPPTAGRALYGRFVPSRDLQVTLAAFLTTALATVNDPVEIGVYNASLGLLATSGPVTGKANASTTVPQTVPLAVNLLAGSVYYLAFLQATIGGTAASFQAISFSNAGAADFFATGAPNKLMAFQSAQAALPAAAALTTTTNVMPLVALRES